jgi:hypothetical protein
MVTMERALLVRRLGHLALAIGGLAAAVGLVSVAYAVDRSGCIGYEFDCLNPLFSAALVTLILGVPVAIGALWLSALTPADDATAIRRPGPALLLANGGAVAWGLLSLPAAVLLMQAVGENAIPQSGAPPDGRAFAYATGAVALAVMMIGLVAVTVVRRGARAVAWLMLAALAGYLLASRLT